MRLRGEKQRSGARAAFSPVLPVCACCPQIERTYGGKMKDYVVKMMKVVEDKNPSGRYPGAYVALNPSRFDGSHGLVLTLAHTLLPRAHLAASLLRDPSQREYAPAKRLAFRLGPRGPSNHH